MPRHSVTVFVVGAAVSAVVLSACASKGAKSTSSTAPTGSTSGTSSSASAVVLHPVLPAGDGKATCSAVSIAYIGGLTGANPALGQAIDNGAKLALKQHNTANPGCQVGYKEFDTQGTPDGATGPVTQALNETDIIGVIGLPFSGESKATGKAFQDANLVHITPSATNPGLTTNGWTTFFRALGNDNSQGPAAAKFIADTLAAKTVCVIEDDSDYGKGLAKIVTTALGSKVACSDDVKSKQTDFSATVGKIVAKSPDAVFYSGYYREAGPFAAQLKQSGYKGKIVTPDGVKDPQFIKAAGQTAAQGVYFTCPCVPADASTTFASQYQAAYGTAPQTYSAEAYDSATVLLQGIDKGSKDRASELAFVKAYDADGITKHYQWDSHGELAGKIIIWAYTVQGDAIVKVSPIS